MKRNHNYAQHFLRSPRLVAELIGHSNIRKNDTVVDLGAGSGVITSVLARRSKQVIAVEVEPSSLAKLRVNMRQHDNVAIIDGDILDAPLPMTPYKVFANIPFQLSAQIVRRLTGEVNAPKSIYLIVQRQFAFKLVPSEHRFTSQLGAELMPWWQAKIRRPLRRTDFTPPPAVDTVLLEIKPHEVALLPLSEKLAYTAFVERCYQRQDYFTTLAREQGGVSSERKPSELTVEQWLRLYALTKSAR